MADLEADFKDAVARSDKLPKQPVNIQLELYSYFKQVQVGDVTGERPGRVKVRARAKFDEWTKRIGMSKEDAMKAYIALIDKLEHEQK